MSTRQEFIEALTTFYQEVVKQPGVDESALKLPPASGWNNLDLEGLHSLGKTADVIDLLRYLPYLELEDKYKRILIYGDTKAVAYNQDNIPGAERTYPIPGHCIYLADQVDGGGYSLILDTERGTITEFSLSGGEIQTEYDDNYDNIPLGEKWRAQLTLPAAECLNRWTKEYARLVSMLVPNRIRAPTIGTFYHRANGRQQADQMAQETGPFEVWQPDLPELLWWVKDEDMMKHVSYRWQHVARLYDCFLRHGWPDNFDKQSCTLEVMELEEQKYAEDKRWGDAHNPDADLYDD